MQVALTFYRRTNFHKHAQFACAFLLIITYFVLYHGLSNRESLDSPNSSSKWSYFKCRNFEPKCSYLDGPPMPHKELGPEAPRKRQILLVAYHRGGSTFLGDILNAYPGAFLHFEPLLLVTGNVEQVRNKKEVAAASKVLRNLYSCRFGTLIRKHKEWVTSCWWCIHFNLPALADCPNLANFCYGDGRLEAECASYAVQIAKVVRLRLEHVTHLLRKLPDLRIVHLTRDPRGLYNSRRKWSWCNGTQSCIAPEVFCEDMRKDLATASRFREQFPNRIIHVRYHDLATDTANQVGKLLDFLELPRNAVVDEFIRTHTTSSKNGKEDDLLTTYRDSKNRPFLWQKQLSDEDIALVEASCSDVIRQLGFNLTALK